MQASDTLSIEIFSDKAKQQISGLSESIQMEFSVASRDAVTRSKIEMIANGSQPLSDITCAYFDTTTQKAST